MSLNGNAGRRRRHTNNVGARQIKNGTHEKALRRIADRLGVPYGCKEEQVEQHVEMTREEMALALVGERPGIQLYVGVDSVLRRGDFSMVVATTKPWAAVAMEAKAAAEVQALAGELAAKLATRAKTWRGWGISYTGGGDDAAA